MEQMDVGGLRIAYHRAGAGPLIVLVHGYVGDSRTWRHQIEELCDEFTVVAWDGPGAGRSSDPPEGFGVADYADCLAQFITGLGLGRPHVAGLSFGGTVVIELYRRHSSLPVSLVLASAYAGWAGSLPAEEVERRLGQALALADLPPEELVRQLLPTMFSPSAPQEAVDEFGATLREFHPAGLRAMARAGAECDQRQVLSKIDVPTLLVYGGNDVRAPLSVAEELHAAIPSSTLTVLPGAGHACNIEAARRFNAEIRAFLHDLRR